MPKREPTSRLPPYATCRYPRPAADVARRTPRHSDSQHGVSRRSRDYFANQPKNVNASIYFKLYLVPVRPTVLQVVLGIMNISPDSGTSFYYNQLLNWHFRPPFYKLLIKEMVSNGYFTWPPRALFFLDVYLVHPRVSWMLMLKCN